MLTSIDVYYVKFIFDSTCLSESTGDTRVFQFCKYSPKRRCRPSSCLLAVFGMFLANSSPISLVFTAKTTQSRPQVFSVNC